MEDGLPACSLDVDVQIMHFSNVENAFVVQAFIMSLSMHANGEDLNVVRIVQLEAHLNCFEAGTVRLSDGKSLQNGRYLTQGGCDPQFPSQNARILSSSLCIR